MGETITPAKTIFIEFDNALCIHYLESIETEEIYTLSAKEASRKYYSASYVNMPIYRYLIAMQEEGWQVVLLTNANSKYLALKKEWAKEHCKQIKFKDYVAVTSDIEKVVFIKAYTRAYQNTDNNAILIDINTCIKNEAQEAGIELLSPQIIANEMYAQIITDTKEKKPRQKKTADYTNSSKITDIAEAKEKPSATSSVKTV